MAVTYNNYSITDVGFIKRYDASAGTWSANLYGSSVFDYFDDDCTVGDYIIFGGSTSGGNYGNRPIWRGIKLYVGTAFAATSYTIVWEYANLSGGWTALPGLVDGTNQFANTGECVVMHDPLPIYGRIYPSTGEGALYNTCTWIRARITAVDTPTEGGAQSTQEVEVGDHRIYIDGYSEGTPCTLNDVYNADVAGGWGVVTKQDNAYTIISHFKVNEDAYFKSTNELLQHGKTGYGGLCWYWEGNVQFGEKDATTGRGYNGSYLRKVKISSNTAGSASSPQSFKFYGGIYLSDLSYSNGIYLVGGTVEFIDAILGDAPSLRGTFASASFIRCTFIGGSNSYTAYCMVLQVTNLYIEDVLFINKNGGDYLLCTVGTSVISNCKFAGTPPFINCHLIGQAGNTTFINPEGFTIDDIKWDISRGIEQYFTLKYSINLKVLDSSGTAVAGATVSFGDTYSDEIADQTTDANGEIDEQTITYCRAQGIANPTGTYYANPLTITISKSGWKTQTHLVTMDEKKDLIFTLEPEVPIYIGKGQALINIDPADGQNNILV